ncbi:MAG: hypothetical protein KDC80_25675, partial [Saprospiraceae bacterium]|nr:hypothetical protein [Saprospiraceae bacterium]
MRFNITALLFLIPFLLIFSCQETTITVDWPTVESQTKPWTRWWWQGSSVTKEGLTANLEALRKAGIGGVEITPIYGVIGDEEHFISYLSAQWMEMLEHTLSEAQRLGLGVDMANGTGWPFGGPWVGEADACKYLAYKKFELDAGEQLGERVIYPENGFVRAVTNQVYQLYGMYQEKGQPVTGSRSNPETIPAIEPLTLEDLVQPVAANPDLQGKALDQVRFNRSLPLQTLMAFGPDDQILDLSANVGAEGNLEWTAPAGHWTLYAIFQGWHGKMVERAAPGGEGNVIDHFSASSIHNYLLRFDSAFAGVDLNHLRAFFNDSYEVDDARGQSNWTPDLLDEFSRRRGYDLQRYLPALLMDGPQESQVRVLSDFRETFSDLILENFTEKWADWAQEKGKMIRNQSHGSPANILDLYAASGIPETEGTEILRIKFASSAAHVAGHSLTSAEAATWLDEHFLSDLSSVKQNLDRYLIGGVNHLFYHGTCYSPPDEKWPGRLFYAAIHKNDRNPLWHDWPALNQYIARVQSFLQSGKPANDILLYFPMYDRFATPGRELLEHFDGHGPTLEATALEKTATHLQESGYTFDFISDRQIQHLQVNGGRLETGGTHYKTILIPPCTYMPLSTLRQLRSLAGKGATIVFESLPKDVPGLADLESRQEQLRMIKDSLVFRDGTCELGQGRFMQNEVPTKALNEIGIEAEEMTERGLQFIGRELEEGMIYFITNWSEREFSDWIRLRVKGSDGLIFDPMTGDVGAAIIRKAEGQPEAYLQLQKGQGLILLVTKAKVDAEPWPYVEQGETVEVLDRRWSVRFVDGGPALPPDLEMENLQSWSAMDSIFGAFSGRAIYQTE